MQIVTGNSLGDGRVVFQTAFGWTHDINQAELFITKEALDEAVARALKAAAENRVVEPYAIEVARGATGLVPVKLRERIRADGPTAGNSLPKGAAAREAAA